MPGQSLRNRRILVVEDEYFLARDLSRDLAASGASVAGPVPTVGDALALLETELSLDGAVLDVNLGGEMVYPVADALALRSVPFVFVTGYDHAALPARHAARAVCEKPLNGSVLVVAIGSAIEHPA